MPRALDDARDWFTSRRATATPSVRSLMAVRTAVLTPEEHATSQQQEYRWGWLGSVAVHGLVLITLVAMGFTPATDIATPNGIAVEFVVLPLPGPVDEKRPDMGVPMPTPAPRGAPTTAAEAPAETPAPIETAAPEATTLEPTPEQAPVPLVKPPTPQITVREQANSNIVAVIKQPDDNIASNPLSTTQLTPRDAAGRQAASQGPESYLSQIAQQLEAVKRYPMAARVRLHEGEALIRLSIAHDGQLTSWKLVEATGSSLLDRAISTMVRDAQPFPARPENQTLPHSMIISVPIRFSLSD